MEKITNPPSMASNSDGMTVEDAWEYIKTGTLTAWSKTTRRIRAGVGIALFFIISILFLSPSVPSTSSLPPFPSITIDYKNGNHQPYSPYNVSKVALLIENRATPALSPLLLHFMSVVPPDWRFRFMGSFDSVAHVNQSRAVRDAVASGKLDLTYIPANMTTGSQEEISQFLTNLWVYETLLAPAEWLLVFQTDSMLCANSRQSLNNFLEYDWVGAPWNPKSRFGGNGGLSLRRVSAIVDVLRNQQRPINGQAEDVWLTDRLGHRPNAKLANGTASLIFSGEQYSGTKEKISAKKKGGQLKEGAWVKGIDDWRDGFYEPMGYHTGGGGTFLHSGVWGTAAMRRHIWDYCPEVKIMLQNQMDAKAYVPGECHPNWKRDIGVEDMGELVGDDDIPALPEGLMPW